LQLCRQRRPARTTLAVASPLEADQLSVPAQQRLRGHDQMLPASPWQSSSRSGEKCPVGTSKAGTLVLSPKDAQFVAEHDDLKILGALVISNQQPEQHPDHQVHER